ncbi:response regulator transcription factor [Acinetobacter larvae]|uniref:DNA-binding response regulator n=1 Tax=Acinetobacter larvae TaxID=1789224 RepID=A0A1B2M1J3_9GAMM|nr:response regulator transcription factor [Acinetobacter larvae]AOA59055.1 DNA-binding response regulator [Acinetobacter larvae]
MRILIIDDHLDLITNIFAFFEKKQYVLDAAQDAIIALQLCKNNHYDMIILDWMLPKITGITFLEQLRALGINTPVIILTAKATLEDKLKGFSSGADDYLTKPFSLEELEARINALHNRVIGKNIVLNIADLQFDLSNNEVKRQQKIIQLRAGEKKILALLMRESPHIVSKEQLEFALWQDNPPDKDLLRTHIYELRKKIDSDFHIKLIKTCYKQGYKMTADEN